MVAITVLVAVLMTDTELEPRLAIYANGVDAVPVVGVTVIVAVTGALVAFVAVNDAISPVPFAANPIDGVLFVQL